MGRTSFSLSWPWGDSASAIFKMLCSVLSMILDFLNKAPACSNDSASP